jgi:ABC-type transport system involved in multi-copper enzyme maturation permease subunit
MDILLLAAVFTAFIFICLIYLFDNSHNMYIPFIILLVVLVGISIIAGSKFSNKKELKKPITPSLHIECNSSKCDTTYVYEFK